MVVKNQEKRVVTMNRLEQAQNKLNRIRTEQQENAQSETNMTAFHSNNQILSDAPTSTKM